MATYVMSDIHGCYDKFLEMLDKINFSDDDMLYILGDLVDRGPDGIRLLFDVTSRPNVAALVGNHDYVAAFCMMFLMKEINEETTADEQLMMERLGAVDGWLKDGGRTTLDEFTALDPDRRDDMMAAFDELDLYVELELGDREFVLVHAGIENFDPDKPLEDYSPFELFTARPDPYATYFPDRYLVVGHTPTRNITGEDSIFFNGNFIDIDCGCGWGGRLGCLRLDDFAEFYV